MHSMATLFFFQSDTMRYCVATEYVERVTWLPALSSLDGAPVWLAGLLNLQGRSVPVIDFSRFMGHAERPLSVHQKLLILKNAEQRVAIIVDQVNGIEEVSGELLPLPHLSAVKPQLGAELAHVLLGEVRQGDAMVMYVNASSLLDVPTHWPVTDAHAGLLRVPANKADLELFQARMHQLAEVATVEDVQTHAQFAIVSTGSRVYAIALNQIVEFSLLHQYTLLPGSPAAIVGCMNLRGEIVSIVDVGILVGSEPSPRNASVVVLLHQGRKFSCLIQSIERLVSVAETQVVPMHDNEELHPLAKNLLRDGSDVITILNLDAVIALCEAQQKNHTNL